MAGLDEDLGLAAADLGVRAMGVSSTSSSESRMRERDRPPDRGVGLEPRTPRRRERWADVGVFARLSSLSSLSTTTRRLPGVRTCSWSENLSLRGREGVVGAGEAVSARM